MKLHPSCQDRKITAPVMWAIQLGFAASALGQSDKPAGTGGVKTAADVVAESLANMAWAPMRGQIAVGINHVSTLADDLAAIASKVPSGNEGQLSPWFSKLQSVEAGLRRLAASKQQTDLFAQIPLMAEFISAAAPDSAVFRSGYQKSTSSLSTT